MPLYDDAATLYDDAGTLYDDAGGGGGGSVEPPRLFMLNIGRGMMSILIFVGAVLSGLAPLG